MLLKSFVIKGLFGTFNYTLDFSEKSNLIVLTGLNGYGKTTILRILSSISSKEDLFYLYEIPFLSITVNFDTGTSLFVSKVRPKGQTESDLSTDELLVTKFSYKRGKKTIMNCEINQKMYLASDYYEKNYKKQIESEQEAYSNSFKWMSSLRYFEEFDDNLEKLNMNLSLLNTIYIRSQRLYNEEKKGKSQRVINEVNQKMSNILKQSHYDYLNNAQQLDGHQIDELLADDTPQLSEVEYQRKADTLKKLVKELLSYNLLPQLTIRPYNPQKAPISSVYINTLERKLQTYDETRKKLRLFLQLLNNKEFVNKRFSFSRNEGLRVLLNTGGVLKDLTKLSSGEQNEIFLLFKFIFEVPEKSILLIDEPELSLHVAWQLQFIQDVKEIAKTRDLQIVIATHSPEIVSESFDNCVDLTEMANQMI